MTPLSNEGVVLTERVWHVNCFISLICYEINNLLNTILFVIYEK